MEIPFKTKPREKQLVALARSVNRRQYAYFMEMRTGKTKVVLDDAAREFLNGRIDCLIVMAPNDVHRQWVDVEVPKHLCVDYVACAYVASGKVAHKRRFLEVHSDNLPRNALRVLSFNIESAANKTGRELIKQALQRHNCMFAIDESDSISTPGAARTRFLLSVAPLAVMRRILTGTPITQQGPLNLYAQFKFLDPRILKFTTFAAFRARYAQLLNSTDRRAIAIARKVLSTRSMPQLLSIYKRAVPFQFRERFDSKDKLIAELILSCPDAVIPPMVAEDENGKKIYKNLEEITERIAPFTYRLTASECTDMPVLVPITLPVTLLPEQRRIYNEMIEDALAYLSPPPDGTVDALQWYLDGDKLEASNALTKVLRAQQVIGGHVSNTDGELRYIKHNRIKVLMDFIPQVLGKCIIWARYRPEIDEICAALREEYGVSSVVEFHGGIKSNARNDNKKAFQDHNSDSRFLVGQQAAGGVGHTFDAANTVIFYSNSHSARVRWQAEVRASAEGKKSIAVVDLVARDTIDEKILRSLSALKQTSDEFKYA